MRSICLQLTLFSSFASKGRSVCDVPRRKELTSVTPRPGSVQTAKQQQFVAVFAHHLRQLRTIYVVPPLVQKQHSGPDGVVSNTTVQLPHLSDVLRRQRKYLHGEEVRLRRLVPKVCIRRHPRPRSLHTRLLTLFCLCRLLMSCVKGSAAGLQLMTNLCLFSIQHPIL